MVHNQPKTASHEVINYNMSTSHVHIDTVSKLIHLMTIMSEYITLSHVCQLNLNCI